MYRRLPLRIEQKKPKRIEAECEQCEMEFEPTDDPIAILMGAMLGENSRVSELIDSVSPYLSQNDKKRTQSALYYGRMLSKAGNEPTQKFKVLSKISKSSDMKSSFEKLQMLRQLSDGKANPMQLLGNLGGNVNPMQLLGNLGGNVNPMQLLGNLDPLSGLAGMLGSFKNANGMDPSALLKLMQGMSQMNNPPQGEK